MRRKIYIIGITPGGALGAKARRALLGSGAILASKRLYGVLSGYEGFGGLKGRIKIISKVEDTVSFLSKNPDKRISVLSTGDPLFFGIARRICEEFPRRAIDVFPAVTSPQLAFSRLKEPWEDALFMSLHGSGGKRKWQAGDIPLLLELGKRLVIFTGGDYTPARVAGFMPPDTPVHVFERLGYPDEKMTQAPAKKIIKKTFIEPNLMVVRGGGDGMPCFGLGERDFLHPRGLITKDEVRAVVLHKLRLPRNGVFWDIGAGSGSVSIEAKRLAPALKVCAIEKDPASLRNIARNAKRLSAGQIDIVTGQAPDALAGLPPAQRVFIGGSGGRLARILDYLDGVIGKGGIVVVAAITLESLSEATGFFKNKGFKTDVSAIWVARGEPLGDKNYMKAMNPVFIVRGVKGMRSAKKDR